MKRVLLAVVVVVTLTGCTTNGAPLPSPTMVSHLINGRYLLQYTGVHDMPDSWPCGLQNADTCVWLPKVDHDESHTAWEDVP